MVNDPTRSIITRISAIKALEDYYEGKTGLPSKADFVTAAIIEKIEKETKCQ